MTNAEIKSGAEKAIRDNNMPALCSLLAVAVKRIEEQEQEIRRVSDVAAEAIWSGPWCE